MPELPDVEAYRRRLMDAGLDKRIEHVAVRKRRVLTVTPGTLRRHLKGKRLTETRRHGKWLLARIGKEEDWLAMHFGMTGALVPFEPAEEDLPKHTVLALELEPGPSVAVTSKRMLGKVTLTSDPGGFAAEHHLGPDAHGISAEGFLARLEGRTGTVKGTLMDQSVVAGIGNVYADEVLFHARIDPRVGVDALSEQQLRRVHRESQRVLERAIKARTEGKKLPRSWLLPLRRERDPECPRCGGRLSQGRVGGRETLWCPRHLDADSD